ncbi:hypothetical protein NUU61_008518 [Penicillium alfredii]|uniref:Uncharacterized protein n=1 Tax=Penicillium alfredii TaxID=1506179 RepID=A0A9W9JW15_9EURO|nr:uncharacterized protein NUU61_008518 [Penicillium alfredii]KAJ5083939.1 hypothetical protein NUU61_008518 [Penicillium alfredii]
MTGDARAGWAIRRQQRCLKDTEVGRHTWGSWYACCPSSIDYSSAADGNTRCDEGNTKGDTVDPPRCANSTGSLWWQNGYFCCENDLLGYYYSDQSTGCGDQQMISDGQVNGSTIYPAQQGHNPHKSSNSSTNKGTIAGGVVGGVCGTLIIAGLIWYFLRRRRSKQSVAEPDESFMHPKEDSKSSPTELEETSQHGVSELNDGSSRKEMPADTQPRQELPANPQPCELP